MSDELPLDGCSVLVVDDDFYLAQESREALEEAGATVLGPYSQEDEALESLQRHAPGCAVIDLNLGSGPRFEVARAAKARGVPMVLVIAMTKASSLRTLPRRLVFRSQSAALRSLQRCQSCSAVRFHEPTT